MEFGSIVLRCVCESLSSLGLYLRDGSVVVCVVFAYMVRRMVSSPRAVTWRVRERSIVDPVIADGYIRVCSAEVRVV